MPSSHTTFMSTTAAVLLLALTPQALADVDGDAVFDALAAQMKRQGLELSSDSVETRGDDVALRNLEITVPEGDDGIRLDRILLEDVTEIGNGSYLIGRIAVPGFTQAHDGWSVGFEGGHVEGYYLGGADGTDPVAALGLYRSMEVGAVEVATNGNTVFRLAGITSSMSPYKPGATLDMTGEVKDFFIDFAEFPSPEFRNTLAEIGYTELSGRMTGTGTWDTNNGDMALQQNFVLDDAAQLNVEFEIGGYTPQLLTAIQEMQKSMEGQSEEAMGFAMLGLMQQLEIGRISIEIIDDSATNRLLDFAAKKQGTNREGVVAMAKGTLPFALAQLQNPEFAAKVTAAIGSFLDEPGSLSIVAAPPAPVPVAQIMGSAMSTPQSLINVLGLNVSAND
ncbi:hypothetical protein HTY61_07930 [Oricola thermophila]|uniref:DUF945 domain-containing protein n=2 Tax=Oricola thermophila TaxID=2742145 RepID=A0A6N1VBL8_9HYPH|nr:hypothetical protein HTY61_07930 [Oricola thermophila]